MMSWVEIVSAALGLSCVVLAGRNSKYNFWVGYLYTAALFFLFLKNNLVACLLLQPVSLGINILGHYRWTHPKEEEQSVEDNSALKVSMLTNLQRVFVVFCVLMIAAVWGWLLDTIFPADPHPYLDSCVTVLILMAQFLSALKKWDCWIAWMIVNVAQIILHISVGHIFMPVVCALYLVNGIWALVSWKRRYNKNA